MVHAGLQEAFAMQSDPKSNGSEFLRWRQRSARKINLCFFWLEVHVTERDDPFDRLLQDLRAPARLRPRVITLAAFEPEFFQNAHQIEEMFARGPKCVVIVIRPSQPERILPPFLNLPGAVVPLPIGALLGKNDMTGHVAPDQFDDTVKCSDARSKLI